MALFNFSCNDPQCIIEVGKYDVELVSHGGVSMLLSDITPDVLRLKHHLREITDSSRTFSQMASALLKKINQRCRGDWEFDARTIEQLRIHSEQDCDPEILAMAKDVKWDVDLTREINSVTVGSCTYQLRRSVEQDEEETECADQPTRVIETVLLDLHREEGGESKFCTRWRVKRHTNPEGVKLEVRAFVGYNTRARQPGAYRMADGRVEVVSHHRLGGELVTVYAANQFLTEKVRTIFGGSATVLQVLCDYSYRAEQPMIDADGLRNLFGRELPLCIDNDGQLSFISLRF